jgi:hypothetical protein
MQLVPPNKNCQSLITYLDMGNVLRPVAKDVGFFISDPMSQTSRAVPLTTAAAVPSSPSPA